jgi:hypothetical protein
VSAGSGFIIDKTACRHQQPCGGRARRSPSPSGQAQFTPSWSAPTGDHVALLKIKRQAAADGGIRRRRSCASATGGGGGQSSASPTR